MKLTVEEIDAIALNYLALLKNKASKEAQNECISKLKFLVSNHTRKYKQFSNYADLEQDGMEALLLALRTFKSSKGSFAWWANKYIKTRICRSANNHSTIRVPIKKAKDHVPWKVDLSSISEEDQLVDCSENNCLKYELLLLIKQELESLNDLQKNIIKLYFGIDCEKLSIEKICESVGLTRNQVLKELKLSINKIKKSLKRE